MKLNPSIAKIILTLNSFVRLKVMCLGYNEDDENYTELVWRNDKNLDFNEYKEFQLWYV
jgi:hypothetical protein